jgi:hypothetical protein
MSNTKIANESHQTHSQSNGPGKAKAHVDHFLHGLNDAPVDHSNFMKAAEMMAGLSAHPKVREALELMHDWVMTPLSAKILAPVVAKDDHQKLHLLFTNAATVVHLKANAALQTAGALDKLKAKLASDDVATSIHAALRHMEKDFSSRLMLEVSHRVSHDSTLAHKLVVSNVAALAPNLSKLNLTFPPHPHAAVIIGITLPCETAVCIGLAVAAIVVVLLLVK